MALREAVAVKLRQAGVTVQFESSPVGSSQANGMVVSAKHSTVISARSVVMAWASMHAAFLFCRAWREVDGRTPFELRKGRPYRRALPPWGEKVQWQLSSRNTLTVFS